MDFYLEAPFGLQPRERVNKQAQCPDRVKEPDLRIQGPKVANSYGKECLKKGAPEKGAPKIYRRLPLSVLLNNKLTYLG